MNEHRERLALLLQKIAVNEGVHPTLIDGDCFRRRLLILHHHTKRDGAHERSRCDDRVPQECRHRGLGERGGQRLERRLNGTRAPKQLVERQ